jgi:hypothetical protein
MERKYTKIALVICFLGKLPWYFTLFLKTCATNTTIDFIFISDNRHAGSLPPNFKWIHKTRSELEKLAKEKTGLNIPLKYAYKLCDIKPAYGIIFHDYLKGYDFWGHCDIDIVFGDIRSFITEGLLQKHDVICIAPTYVTGFFTLFRNDTFMNWIYECSKDYKYVFENEKHFCFDECNHMFEYLIRGRSILEVNAEVQSMTYIIKKLEQEGKIKPFFDQYCIDARPGNMEWNNGILLFKNKFEVLLYHMVAFKQLDYYFFPFSRKIPDRFYIEPFYFSKYRPGSLMGKLYKHFYTLSRRCRLALRSMKNNILSSSKIKRRQLEHLEEYPGTYTHLGRTKMHTDIVFQEDRFLIRFYKDELLPLRHIKNNRFFCKEKNIEIEFEYSVPAQKICLHGRSLFSGNHLREYKI